MLELKKVAVTGGLASGKTTVSHLFAELGAFVVSSDEIVHELYNPESDIGVKLIKLLGKECVVEGTFDKKRIADKIFSDPLLLQQLEQLLHPEVQKVIEARYRKVCEANQKNSLFIVEIPLLFEAGFEDDYDVTIAVKADLNVCRKRFGNDEEFERRMKRLMPMDEKAQRADIVITNNGSLLDLQEAVRNIFQQLTS